jgi:hypothetical protein
MAYQRRTNRHGFVPRGESLEPRIVLSAEVGINLDLNASYNNDPIWTDLHNLASKWYPSSGSTVALTADGYPLANASTSFVTANYPNGTYGFSYTGSGTVTFSDVGQSMGPVTVSNGVTTGTVVVNHLLYDGSTLGMQVTGINPANPMDNFHLMAPGYGNGTTPEPMFMPAFIATLKPFSDIRFLNWDMVNVSTVANWSARVGPDAFLTDTSAGVPYEDMIELCNEVQKDMWINIPVDATPQYVQSLAQLIDTDLDPNLNLYVEYANETWNSSTIVENQVLTAAKANPLVTQSSNTLQMIAQQSAYQEVSDAQIFKQVFGSQSARVLPIMSGWSIFPSYSQYALQFIQQTYGAPSQYIYATAVSAYIELPGGDDVSGLTLSQLFADLNQYMTSSFVPNLQSDITVAQEYGLPLIGYEGGEGLPSGTGILNSAVFTAAQNDPRMYQLFATMVNLWDQGGGALLNDFQLDEPDSIYGDYGMLPNVLAPGSQKFDGLVSTILPAGDANLDGIVDDADFQNVEANYGDTGAFWEQGDFNDDGVVNWQDLNMLRQNLDPAGFTLSQFAQAGLFGQLSAVIPGQSLEYDGYGVTYASSTPFTASSGTVQLNENSQGGPIVLNGAAYAEGLGVLANSSVSLALNGQYTRFESTVGVDGSSDTGSSVIFDVYGDGTLLYQSPTMTYGSIAIPIDVSVTGVTTLTLTVSAAPGSTAATDNAVWADARDVSTANFGSVSPYTLTWQLSQNGTVISTQTTDSFVFATLSGTYSLALTVTDAQGDSATANTTVVVSPAVASASYVGLDLQTQGGWVGTYGTQGYDLVGDISSLPNYATVVSSGASTYTWNSSTTATPALTNPSDTFGDAAAWESPTSFSLDVNLTDGQPHELSLYAVDFASQGLTEQVQILSAATGATLDTKTLWSFSGGEYLQWAVSGNIVIQVTKLTGPDAVLSGLFVDPPTTSFASAASAAFVSNDTVTEGDWIGAYGAQGYDVIGAAAIIPGFATITPSGEASATWAATTTDARALQTAGGASRVAAYWYSPTSFTVDVNLTDGRIHQLELYFLDWDNAGRSESVIIRNAVTGAVLSTQTVAGFLSGEYLEWAVSGNVVITITKIAGPNAELSGIFLNQPATLASFIASDTTTQGNWIGAYGLQGYDVIGSSASIPSYATVTTSGASSYNWAATTTDPRALQTASGSGRIAAGWYSVSSFSVDVNLTDGQTHDLELYFLDWDGTSRNETVTIANATTGTVFSKETVSSFHSGVYLEWAVSGSVLITITNNVASSNAFLSGLFFDPPTVALTVPLASVAFVARDTATEGNWIGTYGAEGYDIIGSSASIPSYATVTASGESSDTWAATTTDPRALQTASSASRIAACWYSATTFTVAVSLTDGQTHNLELYFLDWDSGNRGENVTIANAYTGRVLSTEAVSSFRSGVYLEWAVSGNVLITITKISGSNAVLSGLFFDSPATKTSASFIKQDTTTEGTWIGTYGSQGYDVIGSSASIPSYATVTPAGELSHTWAPTTTDPRALQTATGASRLAACWYSVTPFTVDVNLTDGQTHDLELYFLDWDKVARSEIVTISNATTGALISTKTVSSFQSGVYLEWAVSGNVLFTITSTTGSNAVLSGLFFGPPATAASTATASFINLDTTTEGTWIGTYGSQGYDVIGSSASIPSYATVTPAGELSHTWAPTTTDPRALQTATGASRLAACWYSVTPFTVDVNLTDGQTHDLELYFLDWDKVARSEIVTISNATTGALISTKTVSSFQSGVYLEWAVSGNVLITITSTTGSNAVLSGLFFGP